MKIAIVGAGGREHALAWALARSPRVTEAWVLPGNGGTPRRADVSVDDVAGLVAFAKSEKIELTVVGPEASLAAGVVDAFQAAGLRAFGPTKFAARLETSKVHAKAFMRRHGVATARFEAFATPAEARGHVEGRCVVKYDGLAGGKGVFVCDGREDALAALLRIERDFGAEAPVVLEERLEGFELSILGVTDGSTFAAFPPAQDHKRLLDGDRGPNTGGMGVFAPVPAATPALLARIRRDIVEPTLRGLDEDDLGYLGFLYFGVMVTPEGPKLLEYNARLGDPEAEALLPLLDEDLVTVVESCLEGRLERRDLRAKPGFSACVVLAAEGYPEAPRRGDEVTLEDTDLVFHAGTRREGERLVTSGGRVLDAVGLGASLEDALAEAYSVCDRVHFHGKQFRRDVGRRRTPKRLAVLLSGRGSNMTALARACTSGVLLGLARIAVVVADRENAKGIEAARALGLDARIVVSRGRGRDAFEVELLDELAPFEPDYVCLAGFLRLLSPRFVAAYRERIVNVHPADTAAYRGLEGYRYAFERGLPETWVTVHHVDEGMDTGPVLSKTRVDLHGVTTLEEVEGRGLAVEHQAYAATLAALFRRQREGSF